MAADLKPSLLTVEEYYRLPNRDGVIVELHLGSLVELPRPEPWHIDLQDRIAARLKERSGPNWKVQVQMPFRAVPEYDLRAVDVGVVSTERWEAAGEGHLFGSPEIVIEILPPSNRRKETATKMALFLSSGTQQFCAVDRTRKTVSVTGLGDKTQVFKMNGEVPFPLLGTSLKVSEILKD